MNNGTLLFGFLSGLISGCALLGATLMVYFRRVPVMVRAESLRDLSHYGRKHKRQRPYFWRRFVSLQ